MNYKNQALKYFKAFSDKDMASLDIMFSMQITLRDWNITAVGKEQVMLANQGIFDNISSIDVKPLSLYQEDSTVIAELLITVNDAEHLLVTDILEFDPKGLITAIRAYKG